MRRCASNQERVVQHGLTRGGAATPPPSPGATRCSAGFAAQGGGDNLILEGTVDPEGSPTRCYFEYVERPIASQRAPLPVTEVEVPQGLGHHRGLGLRSVPFPTTNGPTTHCGGLR